MQNFINWLNTLNKPNLPNNVEQLQNTRDLDLSDCGLTQIPNIISLCRNLPNLRGINLANNDIRSLPDEFGELHIQRLGLCNNYQLHCIEAIENLSNLQCLYLNGDRVITLPNFPNSLKALYLRDTHLVHLSAISQAQNLEVLDISLNSDIRDINELQNLPNLRQITFDKDIEIPSWLETDCWEYKIELINYYYEIYIFTRIER